MYNENRPIRSGFKIFGLGWLGVLFLIAAVGAIGAMIWGFNVVISDAKGRGDAQMQINSGTNRIEQYDHFFKLDGDIRSQAQNAVNAKAALDAFNKTTPVTANEAFNISEQRNNLQATYTGLVQICTNNVATYNNDAASSYTKAKFLDSALPFSFEPAACSNLSLLPPAAPHQ